MNYPFKIELLLSLYSSFILATSYLTFLNSALIRYRRKPAHLKSYHSDISIFDFRPSLCIVTVRTEAFTVPPRLNACCITFHLFLTPSQREFTIAVSGCESSCFTTHSLFIRPRHQMKLPRGAWWNTHPRDVYPQASHKLADFPGHRNTLCHYMPTHAVKIRWWQPHHSFLKIQPMQHLLQKQTGLFLFLHQDTSLRASPYRSPGW